VRWKLGHPSRRGQALPTCKVTLSDVVPERSSWDSARGVGEGLQGVPAPPGEDVQQVVEDEEDLAGGAGRCEAGEVVPEARVAAC